MAHRRMDMQSQDGGHLHNSQIITLVDGTFPWPAPGPVGPLLGWVLGPVQLPGLIPSMVGLLPGPFLKLPHRVRGLLFLKDRQH